jgi:hypothetical protein
MSFFLAFYSYVFRAFFSLGYFPSYNNPDPKELNFHMHHSIIYYLGELMILSAPFWFILLLINKFKYPKWTYSLYILGVAISVFILVADPFMEWFAD